MNTSHVEASEHQHRGFALLLHSKLVSRCRGKALLSPPSPNLLRTQTHPTPRQAGQALPRQYTCQAAASSANPQQHVLRSRVSDASAPHAAVFKDLPGGSRAAPIGGCFLPCPACRLPSTPEFPGPLCWRHCGQLQPPLQHQRSARDEAEKLIVLCGPLQCAGEMGVGLFAPPR